MDVFDFDGGFIHQNADGEREAAESHEIDRVTTDPQCEHGGGDGEGDVQDDDEGAAQIAQEEEHHEAGERGTEDAFFDEVADGADDPRALIKLKGDVDVFGAGRFELGQVLFHQFDDAEGGGIAALGDGHVHGAFAVHHGDAVHHVAAVADFPDVAHIDRALVGDFDRHGGEVLDVFDDGVGGDDGEAVGQREIAAGADGVGGGHCGHNVIGREAIGAETVRLHIDQNGARTAAKRWWCGNTGQSGKKRAHHVESGVLHLADGAAGILRGEDEIAHWDAARIKPRDESARRTQRHEGARAVHIRDRFRERGGHVRAGMKLELHDRSALDVLGLHVLDAGDVEEVVLVVVGQVAFHLQRVHAAIGLRDVDGRDAQGGEDIAGHFFLGLPCAEEDRHDDDDDGPGMAEGEAGKGHAGRK